MMKKKSSFVEWSRNSNIGPHDLIIVSSLAGFGDYRRSIAPGR